MRFFANIALLIFGLGMSWFGFVLSREINVNHAQHGGYIVFTGAIAVGAVFAIIAITRLFGMLLVACFPSLGSVPRRMQEFIVGRERLQERERRRTHSALFIYAIAAATRSGNKPTSVVWKTLALGYQRATGTRIHWRVLMRTARDLRGDMQSNCDMVAQLAPFAQPHAKEASLLAVREIIASGAGNPSAFPPIAYSLRLPIPLSAS